MQIITLCILSDKFFSFRQFANTPEGMEGVSDKIKEYEFQGLKVKTSPVLGRFATEKYIDGLCDELKAKGLRFDLAGQFLNIK